MTKTDGWVYDLDDNLRLVRDDLQWIIQHRQKKIWESRSYCRSRVGLLTALGTHYRRDIPDPVLKKVMALPEWRETSITPQP